MQHRSVAFLLKIKVKTYLNFIKCVIKSFRIFLMILLHLFVETNIAKFI